MSRRDQSAWVIFRWPLILGGLSLIGLVGALIGDGVWDIAGSLLLATCVVAVGWALVRSRRRP